MTYSLTKGEPVADELKRIVCDEIDSAARHLRGEGRANRDAAIHEARKSVKKIRAVMKLARPELGGFYSRENARLREVARKLSGFRDAAAIIETYNDLRREYPEHFAPGQFASVRAALGKQKKQAAVATNIPGMLKETESALKDIRKSAAKWPLKTDGFEAIEYGLKETYRRGRKALARAKKSPHPLNFHELRKRAKDLWYHIRLIRTLWKGVEHTHEKELKDLESWLGDDHNLVLLRAGIDTDPASYGNAKDTDHFLSLIDRYQKKLRADALESASRLYDERPREYVQRIKQLCNEQPESSSANETTSSVRR